MPVSSGAPSMTEMAMKEVLAELARVRERVAVDGAPPTAPAAGAPFGELLRGALGDLGHSQGRAARLAEDFELGTGNIDLPQVMVELQKSRLKFQLALQVRNRLVSAYQDIMNMPL